MFRKSTELRKPNPYVRQLIDSTSPYLLTEEKARAFQGKWLTVARLRSCGFVDVEIGTGIGVHFNHYIQRNPSRLLVGIERKYKPLIQAFRSLERLNSPNGLLIRYDARFIEDLFCPNEIENVFIHHPDPWEKRAQKKNRLLQRDWLMGIKTLQNNGGLVEFKTDSADYFDFAVNNFLLCGYTLVDHTKDLHRTHRPELITPFERLFVNRNVPIGMAIFKKP